LKLLLDEMFPAAIAHALRAEGYDVNAVQEDSQLRELSDPALFAAAQHLQRGIVTENVKDYLPLDAQSHARPEPHWGLVITTNQSFPRHHDRFIGALARALRALLAAHSEAAAVSAIYWLRPETPEA
jgi:predicted nuclease of predicted toxin-antitoxin system